MPRWARVRHADVPQHEIQRGNNRAQAAYQALFRHQMDEALLKAIRESVNSRTALSNERFKDEIEATLARSVRPGTPGRPRKKGIDE